MTVSFLKYFSNNSFDKKIILKNKEKSFSLKEIKSIISHKISILKDIKQTKIILDAEDNLSFILNFLSCIFSEKEIYLVNDTKKLKEFSNDEYKIFNNRDFNKQEIIEFKTINPNDIIINFFTSGSTQKSKLIKKSLENLVEESADLFYEFNFNKNLEVISTTTLNHLFGITFHLMLPLNNGLVINTDSINYPEDIAKSDAILVSTPSFLDTMKKYNVTLTKKLSYIISAGAKLQDETFEFAKSKVAQRVIDIYGSTETGVIAYRTDFKQNERKLFRGIKILETTDSETQISSNYSYNETDNLGDKIALHDDTIELLGRCDRILKIQEKRLSATEIEEEISKNELVKECYCFEYSKKIATIVVLTPLGYKFALDNSILDLIKKLKSDIKDKFEIIPQKWKFIDAIPKTKNGKINKQQIIDIFNLNLSLPLIISRDINKDYAIFKLYFYSNCNFFQGHFNKFHLLPGIVQLFYANFFTQLAFNRDCHCGQLKKIKFMNIIRPNDILDLKLELSEKGV